MLMPDPRWLLGNLLDYLTLRSYTSQNGARAETSVSREMLGSSAAAVFNFLEGSIPNWSGPRRCAQLTFPMELSIKG